MYKNKFSKFVKSKKNLFKNEKKENLSMKDIKLQMNITIISICITVFAVIGTSLAAFVWDGGSTVNQELVVGSYSMIFDDSSPNLGGTINLASSYPLTIAEGIATTPYKFTIKNNGTVDTNFTLKLPDDTSKISSDGCSSNLISRDYIKIKVSGDKRIPSTNLSALSGNIIDTDILGPGESKTYELRLWIGDNAPNDVVGQHFHAKLELVTEQSNPGEPNMPKLADGMIPVIYDDTNDVWVKADISNGEWYDYDTQKWANAVTVNSCIHKGDINLDGVIDQIDAEILARASVELDTGYTESELISRGDIDNNGEITSTDMAAIGRSSLGNNIDNLCLTDANNSYEIAPAGTAIPMDDINAMWVWIPRFKYRIASNIGSSSAVKNPPRIDVVFESGTSATGVSESVYRSGITSGGTNTNYYTHPAFRNINNITYHSETTSRGAWDEEITGIWVGKFETSIDKNVTTDNSSTCYSSRSETNCNTNNLTPIIKPDVETLNYQTVSNQFLTALKFAGGTMDASTGVVTFKGNDTYGLTSTTDTHMMKNTEWGAVAILSQSQYGKMGNNNYIGGNKEIYKNNSYNSTTYAVLTGRSSGVPPTSEYTAYGTYSYNDKSCTTTEQECTGEKVQYTGTGASTTGTIYGIYDMSGGNADYTMGNWLKYSGFEASYNNSGFNGLNGSGDSTTNGISFPEMKYYDLYKGTSSNSITRVKSIMGDATYETMRWYSDHTTFIYDSHPWTRRGGDVQNGTIVGIFASYNENGRPVQYSAFRTTLIP